jgi:hypothetical protein
VLVELALTRFQLSYCLIYCLCLSEFQQVIVPQIQSQRSSASVLGCSHILVYRSQQVRPKLGGLPEAVPRADSVSSTILVLSIKRSLLFTAKPLDRH